MKDRPLVSIIITCYNYDKYIEEAIRSSLKQTYKNLDLIVINDGSTDNSDKIISQLQREYKFSYIKQENLGIVATRNLGISVAKGEFQMQLDADDILDETYVEKCVMLAIKNRADIVYTQAKIFGRHNHHSNFCEFNLEKLKNGNYIHASSLVRSSFISKRRYDDALDKVGYEDWDIFLDMALDGAKAVLLDEALLMYRKHEAGVSRSDQVKGTINELLARQHILRKQIKKHPDQMSYLNQQLSVLDFSSEKISSLEKELSDIQQANAALEDKLQNIQSSKLFKARVLLFQPIHSIRHRLKKGRK